MLLEWITVAPNVGGWCALMSDTDTTAPASLLALYVLGDCEDWQTTGEIADRIERETGDRPEYETLRTALCRLSNAGRVLSRTVPRDGVQVRQYGHPNNLDVGGVDTTDPRRKGQRDTG